MKYLIIILLFTSCSTYRAYQKVAADPFVDARESVLLAQKCLAVYPFKTDSVRLVSVKDDSSAYQATIDGLLMMIDTLTAQIDTEVGFIDTNDQVQPCKIRRTDSLRIIRNFVKSYRVPPIIRTEIKEIPTLDTKAVAIIQAQLNGCISENNKLAASKETVDKKLQNKQAQTGWILGGGLLLIVLAYGAGKLGKRLLV